MVDRTLQGTFAEPPEEELTPLQYFKLFFKDEILNTIIENTNLCSVQKSRTSVNTNKDEISSFIGIHTLMGIVQLSKNQSSLVKRVMVCSCSRHDAN